MTLFKEIQEQPDVLHRQVKSLGHKLEQIIKKIGKPSRIFIAARGTSDNAARYAKYVWGIKNSIPVTLAAPSMFSLYKNPPNLSDSLVIGISQSGESPDLLSVLQEANQQGCKTLAITNQAESPMAEVADETIDILAGKELAVAATKTYTAQLMTIALLSSAWNNSQSQFAEIKQIPDISSTVLEQKEIIKQYTQRYRFMNQCVVLGRGYNYATAYEWSLKLKEMNYIVAQPYSSADFKHGPIALISNGFPVFAVAVNGSVLPDMAQLIKDLTKDQAAEIFLISDQDELLSMAECPFSIPKGIPEWLSPIISILPAQLFSYYLTLVKHIDPDTPRGLSKVTRTI
jgi:glucosamine--fructose-6-phosphate aminotransferase (isomerizing)